MSISSKVCLKCHTLEKEISPRIGIKINHEAHSKNGIACTRCHNRVSHDLDTTAKIIVSLKIAKIVPYRDKLKMDSCMECHTGIKGQPTSDCDACHTQEFKLPYSCNACHSDNLNRIKPKDHFLPNFSMKAHAEIAKGSLNYCLQCHQKDNCQSCHKENRVKVELPAKTEIEYHPPASHFDRKFMPKGHAASAKERGEDYCNQCHKPKFCYDCHNGLEMPHPADFKEQHGRLVLKEGYKNKCSKCHPNKDVFCEAGCHHVGWTPKMGPMIKAHPEVVEKSGVSNCLTCHTSIYCATCHVSGQAKQKFRD